MVSVDEAAGSALRVTPVADRMGRGGVSPGWLTLTNESVFPGETAR